MSLTFCIHCESSRNLNTKVSWPFGSICPCMGEYSLKYEFWLTEPLLRLKKCIALTKSWSNSLVKPIGGLSFTEGIWIFILNDYSLPDQVGRYIFYEEQVLKWFFLLISRDQTLQFLICLHVEGNPFSHFNRMITSYFWIHLICHLVFL